MDAVKKVLRHDLLVNAVNSATKIRFAIANYRIKSDPRLLSFIDRESRDLSAMIVALRDLGSNKDD